MDYNKPIKPKNQKRLDYFIYKKDKKNYQRYEKMIEEEDTNDDFDFEYRIYNIKTAKEIAETIGNDEICQLLDKAFSEQNKYKYVVVIEVGDEVEEEEENEKKDEYYYDPLDFFLFIMKLIYNKLYATLIGENFLLSTIFPDFD